MCIRDRFYVGDSLFWAHINWIKQNKITTKYNTPFCPITWLSGLQSLCLLWWWRLSNIVGCAVLAGLPEALGRRSARTMAESKAAVSFQLAIYYNTWYTCAQLVHESRWKCWGRSGYWELGCSSLVIPEVDRLCLDCPTWSRESSAAVVYLMYGPLDVSLL